MAGVPITSVSMGSGTTFSLSVVDQHGTILPNSEIFWSNPLAGNLVIGSAPGGGFIFSASTAGMATLTATHTPSGHSADLPVTITNPVMSISFTSP